MFLLVLLLILQGCFSYTFYDLIQPTSEKASFGTIMRTDGDWMLVSAPSISSVYVYRIDDAGDEVELHSILKAPESFSCNDFGHDMDIDSTNGYIVVSSPGCQSHGVVFIFSFDSSLYEWSVHESFTLQDYVDDYATYSLGNAVAIDKGIIVVNSGAMSQHDHNVLTLTIDDSGSFLNTPFFITASNTYVNSAGTIYTTEGFIFISDFGNDVRMWDTNAEDWPRANCHEKWNSNSDHSMWYGSRFGYSMTSTTRDDGTILLLISDATAYPNDCGYGDGVIYTYIYDGSSWAYHPELWMREPKCENHFDHYAAQMYMTPDGKYLAVTQYYNNFQWASYAYLYENNGDDTWNLLTTVPPELDDTYQFGSGVSIIGNFWYVGNPIVHYQGEEGGSSAAGAVFVYDLPL
eukprot:gnl/Dysnectes_brevis/8164_a14337_223.p1 GENE.gnl/Dysnectes_brevis/8164_a14337_223~~gnl/Dysnectes_brevis/8164_a14337_223.p1  ORF type:complete len:405 (+),score=63.16 gnl/Dysnectes_brevis/8164_a14337_223:101-1315(+)